jgi:hypothetical protein
MQNVVFLCSAFTLRLIEPFKSSQERLAGAGFEKDKVVLEYGCGVGSYTISAVQIVGGEGSPIK